MTQTPLPPSLAETVLRLSVRDPEWREAVLGDLREEHAVVSAQRGAAAARRWYWRQALPLAVRFAASRVLPSLRPARRRLSVADIESTAGFGAGWGCELRHAWRSLSQRPALTAVIAVTLGVVLAANAVIFTLADALYLRPFRFPDVGRLVMVASDARDGGQFLDKESVAPADYLDWVTSVSSLDAIAAAEWWDPNFSGVDTPERLAGFRVSPGFFEVVSARPYMGRTFTADDGRWGAHRKALLSYRLWQRQFASRADVIGTTLRLNAESYEVVGVMPPGFAIPHGADVWAPIAFDGAGWAERTRGFLMVFGRLAAGRSMADAQGEMQALVARQAAAHPQTNRDRKVTVMTFARGLGDDVLGVLVAIWQAAAVLLLLVGCANIANLLLARGTERQPEFAVRLALGAGRARLVGQLLLEGACYAVLGVLLGTVFTAVAMRASRDVIPASVVRFVPGLDYLRVDATTFAVMSLLGAVATIACALLPALQSSRSARETAAFGAARTSTASSGPQRVRSLLASAQVAFTVALVVAAALIVSAIERVTTGELGFDMQGLMTAQLTLPARQYDAPERRRAFAADVMARLAASPAIAGVAASSAPPFTGAGIRAFAAEGSDVLPTAQREVMFERVTPEYLSVMRIALVSGRDVTGADREGTEAVALVSRSLAAREWPGRDPIGRRFRLGDDPTWLSVIGVVSEVTHDPVVVTHGTVYRPFAQDPTADLVFVARAKGHPEGVAGDMRAAVRAVDPDLPIHALQTMRAANGDRVAGLAYFARVLAAMSVVALILAVTGVYSLVAYLAARHTREMGVRVALGATRAQVTRLGALRAAHVAVTGSLMGAVLAFGVGRLMQSALFGLVTPRPTIIVAVVATLVATTMAAGYLPSRKAATRDPWQSLRAD